MTIATRRLALRLPADLVMQAQAYADITGRTLSQLVTDALHSEMQRVAEPCGAGVELPVYGGRGLSPGVDLGNNGALLDQMDGR